MDEHAARERDAARLAAAGQRSAGVASSLSDGVIASGRSGFGRRVLPQPGRAGRARGAGSATARQRRRTPAAVRHLAVAPDLRVAVADGAKSLAVAQAANTRSYQQPSGGFCAPSQPATISRSAARVIAT